jgi:hypothetical protein
LSSMTPVVWSKYTEWWHMFFSLSRATRTVCPGADNARVHGSHVVIITIISDYNVSGQDLIGEARIELNNTVHFDLRP